MTTTTRARSTLLGARCTRWNYYYDIIINILYRAPVLTDRARNASKHNGVAYTLSVYEKQRESVRERGNGIEREAPRRVTDIREPRRPRWYYICRYIVPFKYLPVTYCRTSVHHYSIDVQYFSVACKSSPDVVRGIVVAVIIRMYYYHI